MFSFSPLPPIPFVFVFDKGPPSAPQNLIFNINQTTVSLEWSPPADNGGRNDVTYRVLCKRCSWEQGECVPCGSNVGYIPQQTGLVDNYVTAMDLLAHANYTFEVEAVNGVSDLSRSQRLFAAVTVTTGQAGELINAKILDIEEMLQTVCAAVPKWRCSHVVHLACL